MWVSVNLSESDFDYDNSEFKIFILLSYLLYNTNNSNNNLGE